jgi:amino acid adenylation domain-containing protein
VSTSFDHDKTQYIAQLIIDALSLVVSTTASLGRSYLTQSDTNYVVDIKTLNQLQLHSELEGVYLANSLQEGFIYHYLQNAEPTQDDAYRIQMLWHYNADMNPNLLKNAWEVAQESFSSLRLSFYWEETDYLQIIYKKSTLTWQYSDLSQLPANEYKIALDAIIKKDQQTAYDFTKPGLFRIYMLKKSNTEYTMLVNMHHAIIDGWSGHILINYVHDIYSQLLEGKLPNIKKDKAYLEAQTYLQTHKKDHISFWKEKLKVIDSDIDLKGWFKEDKLSVTLVEYRSVNNPQQISCAIPEDFLHKIKQAAYAYKISLSSMLQFAWHYILSTYSQSNYTVVGTVVSGRSIPINDIENSVGLYLNTLPMVVDHTNNEQTVLDALQKVQNDQTEMNIKCTTHLAELHSGGQRLFNTLFIYENQPKDSYDNLTKKFNISFDDGVEHRDYPLSFNVKEEPRCLKITLDYEAEIFSEKRLRGVLSLLLYLLTQITDSPNRKLKELDLIEERQLAELIACSTNQTNIHPRSTQTFIEIFESMAKRYPNSIAIRYKGSKLTYEELNKYSNKIANYMLEKVGIQEEEPVAFLLNRNLDLMPTILSILKTNATYVPISPLYPEERIIQVLKEIQTKLIITHKEYLPLLEKIKREVKLNYTIIVLNDVEVYEYLKKFKGFNPDLTHSSDGLAYILYTSGSTGLPNGVMIENYAFVQTIQAIKETHFKTPKSISTFSVTQYVFDIFGLEYALPLMTGGTLTLGDIDFDLLDCSSYTFIQMTPRLLELKLDCFQNTTFSTLLLGGEAVTKSLLRKSLSCFQNVINVYGPTETTIWSTSKAYNLSSPFFEVSIGSPLPGECTLVLDETKRLLPKGALGELFIGGTGTARGYFNRESLTKERFIYNIHKTYFATTPSEIIYKTGDFVRWLDNDTLQFVGRKDNQVKFKGYRIELNEIEKALSDSSKLVKQCSIFIHKDRETNEQLLLAYIALTKNAHKSEEASLKTQWKQHMRTVLPEYMIPTHFIIAEYLPLNTSGKLDKRELLKRFPYNKAIELNPLNNNLPNKPALLEQKYSLNEVETLLRKILCQLLNQTEVSTEDNFFDLGANSIVLIKMVQKIPENIRKYITIIDVFKHPNIKTLSEFIHIKSVQEG